MSGLWLFSSLAQWFSIVVLVLAVTVLARQIGILHKRIAPRGAAITNEGPAVGDIAPIAQAVDVAGKRLTLGGRTARNTI